MYVTGIVAEYNPFHNGHLYQLNRTKQITESDFVIAVMSGNFTQRGTPSIRNKFIRTQMALSAGVDMVLELPTTYASSSAERFCEAAVSVLNKTGLVNVISFGSEIGDIRILQDLAGVLTHEPAELSQLIKDYLSQGYSFPRARQSAIIKLFSQTKYDYPLTDQIKEAVENPNNILGIEYIKALIKYHSAIKPLTIKRKSSHYHDTEITSPIASATAIRTQFQFDQLDAVKQSMPADSYNLLASTAAYIPHLRDLNDFLHYKLIFSNIDSLYSLWDIPKDIILSILRHFKEKKSIEEIINAVTSKTYTRATVQRAVLRIILNVLQSDMEKLEPMQWIPYIKVLGCKKSASILLSELNKHAHVPVITNLKASYSSLSSEGKLLLDYELRASNIYQYISRSEKPYHQDFSQPFIKI